jgi:uncharacterized protein YjbJ (UPF0337 family)
MEGKHPLAGQFYNMKNSTHDKIAGTANTLSGKVKESAGRLVGNDRLQAKGKIQQVKGQAQKKVGEIEKVLGN